MDTHDLYLQLTKGVRFKRKVKSQEKEVSEKTTENDYSYTSTSHNGNPQSKSSLDTDAIMPVAEPFKYVDNLSCNESKKRKKTQQRSEAKKQKQIEKESITKLRKEYHITVLGMGIPPPITAFEELRQLYGISEILLQNLMSGNITKPTPIQMQSIPILLKGRSLMACAPTGSGKTIAFLMPIINDLRAPKNVGFRALILAPTRELAQQIYRECVRLSKTTFLKIHITGKISQAQKNFGPSKSKNCDILISTPNRVRYMLQQEPSLLNLRSVEWLVIDEADRLMEDGKDNFKEQVDEILNACTYTSKKLALFSATCSVPVTKWAVRNIRNLTRITIGQMNSATDLVHQELLFVGSEGGKLIAMRDLVSGGLKPPVLVFVQSKDRAKQLFEELLYDGINVDIIHADRTQQQRDNCVRAFREGNIWVLICTELMGRGIDFKGVNLVVNYDFPPSSISYIHRIGRTGRAGRPGKAVTFFTQDDIPKLRSIAQIIKDAGGKIPDFMFQMKAQRKSEKQRLANIAPKRDDISTKLKFKKKHASSQCGEKSIGTKTTIKRSLANSQLGN